MLLFQLDEFLLKLLVPWIQDEDLETERRGADDEVCQAEATGDEHVDDVYVRLRAIAGFSCGECWKSGRRSEGYERKAQAVEEKALRSISNQLRNNFRGNRMMREISREKKYIEIFTAPKEKYANWKSRS